MNFSRQTLINCGLILFYIADCIRSLRLLDLRVPTHVRLASEPELACRWELGPRDILYSVKWYKDGKEFFRYIPRDSVPQRKFYLPGVKVKNSDELGSKLVLSNATLDTEGRYRCEVSGERPLFPTVSNHANMIVIDLPESGPVITGFKAHYQIGDQVQVNCTSGPSRTIISLTWYINDEPAPFSMITSPAVSRDNNGYNTSLTLTFKITERHFKNGTFKIKCLATLDFIYWKSNEESARKVSNSIREIFETEQRFGTHNKILSNNGTYSEIRISCIILMSCIQFIYLLLK